MTDHSRTGSITRSAAHAVTAVGLVLAVLACGGRAPATNDRAADAVDTTAVGATGVGAADAISLERTACYGRCPVYRVSVRGDGAVRFEGLAFVADSGAHDAMLALPNVRALFERFDASPFETADSAYVEGSANCGNAVTDTPELTLRRTRDTREHTVRLYLGCTDAPRWIKALATAVDSAVNTDRWITSNPSNP